MMSPITRRQVLGGSVAVAALAALSACGSGTPGQSKSQEASAKAASAAGVTEITFWHRTFTPVENAWYKKVVQDFNKAQSKIVVKDTEIPADAWDQKMKAAQAAGKAPDVYTHSGSIADAVRLGQIHELDSLMDKSKLEEIIDAAKPIAQQDGKYYAYPLLLEPQTVLFWNKDMFKAAGLDPEKGPTSWDELFQTCAKLKPTLKSGQYCISTAEDSATFAWSSVGQQMNFAGHTALTDDWTKPNVEDDGYKKLIAAYKKLWDNGYIPKQALAAYVEGKDYGQKKVAMKVSGSWMMSEIGSDYKDLLTTTGICPFPSADGKANQPTSTLGNFKWVVDAKSKNAKAAADFIAWALAGDPEVLVPFFVQTQFTKAPVRKTVADAVSKDEKAATAPWSSVVTKDVVPYAIPEPVYPWDVSLAVGLAMEKGMKGAKSADDALKEAATTIQKVIDRDKLASIAPKK